MVIVYGVKFIKTSASARVLSFQNIFNQIKRIFWGLTAKQLLCTYFHKQYNVEFPQHSPTFLDINKYHGRPMGLIVQAVTVE